MHCVAGVGIRCGILCSIAVGIAVLNCDLDELLLFEVALEHSVLPENLQQQRVFFSFLLHPVVASSDVHTSSVVARALARLVEPPRLRRYVGSEHARRAP